jgi:hypothetical protein
MVPSDRYFHSSNDFLLDILEEKSLGCGGFGLLQLEKRDSRLGPDGPRARQDLGS